MSGSNKSSNQQQIIQSVLDVPKQALKVAFAEPVEVEFSGGTQEVEIDALDGDNIAIADPITGIKAEVTAGRRLKVETTGTISGSVTATLPPSTDFQPKTITATTTEAQLTFSGLAQVTSITIVAFGTNTDYLLIYKTSGAVLADSYVLFAGSALNLPVSGGATVYYKANAGSQMFTSIAVN